MATRLAPRADGAPHGASNGERLEARFGALDFVVVAPALAPSPARADVACFVGLVAPRSTRADQLPGETRRWLADRGWLAGPGVRAAPYARAGAAALLDVPVLVESWGAFERLYAWEARPARDAADDAPAAPSYLGAAVRSFFAEGGQRCYVVRAGDPLPPGTARAAREARLAALVPTLAGAPTPTPADPASWRGVGHVVGLPDVAFVCLPDLPELVAGDAPALDGAPERPRARERFTACSDADAARPADVVAPSDPAPRADARAYDAWADVLRRVRALLARHGRDAQLLAAVPLPAPGVRLDAQVAALLARDDAATAAGDERTMASSFVQLAYPWVETAGARAMPGGLEPPDGVLAGVLARAVLARGSYRSAAGQRLATVVRTQPPLDGREPLGGRVSLLGRTPDGMRLLSDATASRDATYRPAAVHRLVSAVRRAASTLGDDLVFDASGERLWARVRTALESLLALFYAEGALRGATAADAFAVRCDRTTMTQADLDAGRVIAEVTFDAAVPVGRITIAVALASTRRVAGADGRAPVGGAA